MKNAERRKLSIRAALCQAAVLACLVLFTVAPGRSFAQCEDPSVPMSTTSAIAAAQTGAVQAMTAALMASFSLDMTAGRLELGARWEETRVGVMARLQLFWLQWQDALKSMTKQLSSGTLDQSRQRLSLNDADNMLMKAQELQRQTAESKHVYQTTHQACRFDTAAPYIGMSRRISDAMTAGYAQDFVAIGDDRRNTPAENGNRTLQADRWGIHIGRFCDRDANGGNPGCTAVLPNANRPVMPSRTLFAKETIDMTDADTRDAITQMLFNITGYRASEPIPFGAIAVESGRAQRQTNREYMAQMDAVGALAYSVVADRVPGIPAREIQETRQKMGVADASPTPSVREIREAVVEQLWDPAYYKELFDNPATIGQKELYLKAYGLVMLYDIIAKQEKISNVYAIETANLLDQTDDSRSAVPDAAPLSR